MKVRVKYFYFISTWARARTLSFAVRFSVNGRFILMIFNDGEEKKTFKDQGELWCQRTLNQAQSYTAGILTILLLCCFRVNCRRLFFFIVSISIHWHLYWFLMTYFARFHQQFHIKGVWWVLSHFYVLRWRCYVQGNRHTNFAGDWG